MSSITPPPPPARSPARFRAYLEPETLPFYSRGRHRAVDPPPAGITVLDEPELLDRIDHRRVTGLVVTGPAGAGKTRLTRELGRAARARGWQLLDVGARVERVHLARLAERLTGDVPALLVLDDIETQADVEGLVDWVHALDDERELRVGYVASCRSGYYSTLPAPTRHEHVELSPGGDTVAAEWERRYRVAAVAHILARASLGEDEGARFVCRDIPLLAALLLFLRERGREAELASLLEDKGVRRSVARQARAGPEGRASKARALATVAALLPLDAAALARLDHECQDVLGRLASEGWVEPPEPAGGLPDGERAGTGPEFRAPHDLWSDHVVLGYLDGSGEPPEALVRTVLAAAAAAGAPRSGLVTMQRLRDHPALAGVDWLAALDDALGQAPLPWRSARELLLSTPLLTGGGRVALLRGHEAVWSGAERDAAFQSRLGWLARQFGRFGWPDVPEDARTAFRGWTARAMAADPESDLLVAWGLRLDPGGARDLALAWLRRRAGRFQSHAPIVAWLEVAGSPAEVRDVVHAWLQTYSRRFNAGYVCQAWLEAGGDLALVRPAIAEWLSAHRMIREAGHVYEAWLDARGDTALVRSAIADWLVPHRTLAESSHVYRSWLDAGGEVALVQRAIVAWLDRHGAEVEAQFVYRAWLDAGGDRGLVAARMMAWVAAHRGAPDIDRPLRAWLQSGGTWEPVREAALEWLDAHHEEADATFLLKYIVRQSDLPAQSFEQVLVWCDTYAEHADALGRLMQVVRSGVPEALTERLVGAAAAVVSTRLSRPDLDPVERQQIASVLSGLAVTGPSSPREFARVNRLLAEWIRHPQSYDATSKPYPSDQRPELVARVVMLLKMGKLDAGRDADALGRFGSWLDRWESPTREKARARLADATRAAAR